MSDYYLTYHICNIIFYVLFGISAFLLLFKVILHIIAFMPSKKFPPAKKNHKYAIIIPARNESRVINQILDSIKAQHYPKDLLDTYIIVEHDDDPTCLIAKNYPRTHVFVRQHLELKGKGYALDELFQELLKNDKLDYEAFFIFDADNVLTANFVEEMNKCFDQGYDIAVSYRNNKNWNDSWISACSGLTFSMFNTFDNKPRSKLGLGVTISGTGFYISAALIKKVGGYKFFTLTEDYELRLYSTLNNVKSTYNAQAIFYDEQPVKMKVSWNQRMRWCKGFLQANKIYSKKLLKSSVKQKGKAKVSQMITALGVIPMIVTLISILSYEVVNFVLMIVGLCLHDPHWFLPLIGFGGTLLALYLFLVLYTLALLIAEHKNIRLKFHRYILTLLLNPIFILLYIPIYVNAIFKKEVTWVAIERTKLTPQAQILQNIESAIENNRAQNDQTEPQNESEIEGKSEEQIEAKSEEKVEEIEIQK